MSSCAVELFLKNRNIYVKDQVYSNAPLTKRSNHYIISKRTQLNMNLEQRYLNKINNDLQENLFDLLLTPIQESHQKIKENKKDFIKLLKDAIEIL
jgi:hypothetical protein